MKLITRVPSAASATIILAVWLIYTRDACNSRSRRKRIPEGSKRELRKWLFSPMVFFNRYTEATRRNEFPNENGSCCSISVGSRIR